MTKNVTLPCGNVVLVDDEDYGFISRVKWRKCLDYAVGASHEGHNEKGNKIIGQVFMHKVIMFAGKKIEVDHINGNKLDNRKENLRYATRMQNSHNRRKLNPDNFTSKYKGVSYNKKDKKYTANIRLNYKLIYGGSFDKEIDAAKKYNEMSLQYHGEFGNRNIINEYVKEG